MASWEQWKQQYKEDIKHVVGFEEQFVDRILTFIPKISPDDVIPQYHFIDDKGRNRYIDFMILNQAKGYCLPIELDGYSKMVGNGNEYYKFNDFLERQNSIIKRYGIVLRYTNKKMLNETSSVIAEITNTLQRQSQHKSTEDIKNKQIQEMVSNYDSEIKKLKNEPNNTSVMLQSLNDEMKRLREQVTQNTVTQVPQSKYKHTPLILGIGLVVFCLIGFLLLSRINTQTTAHQTTQETTQTGIHEERVQPPIKPIMYAEPSVEAEPPKIKSHISKPEIKPVEKEKPSPTVLTSASIKPSEEYTSQTVASNKLCGTVAQVKNTARGVYLNLDGRYPNHSGSITLWGGTEDEVQHLIGTTVCANGDVSQYKGKPSMIIHSLNELE